MPFQTQFHIAIHIILLGILNLTQHLRYMFLEMILEIFKNELYQWFTGMKM